MSESSFPGVPRARPALLALEDGSVLRGQALGHAGRSTGEVVFNTACSGYQEILSDPSYHRQIVLFTQPHIGNVGVNSEDEEAGRPHVAGLVVRDAPALHSNWRASDGLSAYLERHRITGICGLDTRRLTRLLRDGGVQRGCIDASAAPDAETALAAARATPSLEHQDLAREVTTRKAYAWTEGSWGAGAGTGAAPPPTGTARYKVAIYDFGLKRNIARLLVDLGCEVTVLPALTPVEEALALRPHGILYSNGPGDPAACDYAIRNARALLQRRVPLLGVCLGHQILALAAGARTVKMKFGHHGANHPVRDLATGRVFISSQNHGFVVSGDALPECLEVTHRSLFDDSVQGLRHRQAPALGFQGHPEASPGPHDLRPFFGRFVALLAAGS